jgi:hypothetical protein
MRVFTKWGHKRSDAVTDKLALVFTSGLSWVAILVNVTLRGFCPVICRHRKSLVMTLCQVILGITWSSASTCATGYKCLVVGLALRTELSPSAWGLVTSVSARRVTRCGTVGCVVSVACDLPLLWATGLASAALKAYRVMWWHCYMRLFIW